MSEKQKPRFARLTNGQVIDLDNIAFIVKAELNKYVVLPKTAAAPHAPNLDGHELDELMATLGELGMAVEVKKIPKIAANA